MTEFKIDERLMAAFKKTWANDNDDYHTNWTSEDKKKCTEIWEGLYGDPAKLEDYKAKEQERWDAAGGGRLDAAAFKQYKVTTGEYFDSIGLKNHLLDDASMQECFDAYN